MSLLLVLKEKDRMRFFPHGIDSRRLILKEIFRHLSEVKCLKKYL
jgi:hypothetical protein